MIANFSLIAKTLQGFSPWFAACLIGGNVPANGFAKHSMNFGAVTVWPSKRSA
jgi:hypothetical protein